LTIFPLVFALLAATSATGQNRASDPPKREPWKLTFADEFDGSSLEFPKWSPHDPWGRERNLEVQAYTPESIQLLDGNARLTARIANAEAKVEYGGLKREYTSGMLTTYGSFAQMYGRFEIRCGSHFHGKSQRAFGWHPVVR